ncbi:hypothetical protein, partial [Streptomyces sp. NPDC058964]|uniref:hypothetical protein n=1 Tax=Streptomyces sp. NPDC058964 TaxID=3346681 RepID=UPI00369BE993
MPCGSPCDGRPYGGRPARFRATAPDGYAVAAYDEARSARPRSPGIDGPEDDPPAPVEPTGPGPRPWLRLVPESKWVKNRVPRDVRADGVAAGSERLTGPGRRSSRATPAAPRRPHHAGGGGGARP